MKITKKLLQEESACSPQLKLFVKIFPDGANVNLTNKARKMGLNLEWFAENFFTAPAWAEYEKVTDTAWAEYEKVRDTAWAEYEKVRDTAWAEYEKVTAPARAEYEKVTDTARAEYEKATDTDAFIAGCKVMGWLK